MVKGGKRKQKNPKLVESIVETDMSILSEATENEDLEKTLSDLQERSNWLRRSLRISLTSPEVNAKFLRELENLGKLIAPHLNIPVLGEHLEEPTIHRLDGKKFKSGRAITRSLNVISDVSWPHM